GGAVHLFARGVLPRVVKADIASLYPSLIRTHRVSPSCDPLGVFLHLVDRLTELRLRHKRAAREAAPGSPDAVRHDATQAAMKVMINSAYGYLGAGDMSLFGDARAADEVTRLGRETLGAVVAGLEAGGVTLVEADTDGVYFSVPEGWTETDERALVARVDASLPPLVRLEFEGRYRAMLSHEVKNYALLGYDGTLTVRGGAMRSSRSERYGDDFLRRALTCLLHGDAHGARAAFDD
ncbi:DNA polymerase domain-containing protein, partial [Deinococcus pimensis]|uniref:DNA polymerase domain-containing protein n=1 Tax=Deinococcus pimensis TaxID=309888 RepID=UPI0024804646